MSFDSDPPWQSRPVYLTVGPFGFTCNVDAKALKYAKLHQA